MYQSKLIEMMRTFSRDELKSFEDFVSSPYYNKKSSLSLLLKNISKFKPEYTGKNLDRKKIYGKLFPGRAYNDKIMRNMMSELLKLGETFLELSYYKKQISDKYKFLLNELLQRNLYKSFEKNLNIAKEIFQKSYINEDNYFDILNINSLQHSYNIRKEHKLEKSPDSSLYLDPLFAFFSMYFFKANYNIASKNVDYNFFYDFTVEMKFIDSLIEYIKKKSLKSEPIILIYYNMLMLYLKPDDERFFYDSRNLIKQYKDSFSQIERRNFHYALTGYCNRKTASGDRTYIYKGFEIYKEMVHEKTYAYGSNDVMQPVIFKNIVKQGVMVKEFDWTINFVETFKEKLTIGFDQNLYHFSLALIHFKKREFDRSFEFLSKVNYENVKDKVDVKCLLIQLYYELNSYENMLSQIDAFKHFLHNDKLLSRKIKDVHLNFARFVLKLINIKFKTSEEYDIGAFKNELNKTISYEKGWLTEKIEELEIAPFLVK